MKAALSILFWIITAVMTILVFLSVFLLTIFLFPFDKKRKLAHAQGFWWADAIIGVNPFCDLSLRGLEHINPQETYVVVANHQSLADIAMLYKLRMQFKWVAKDSLFQIPIFGWCMSMMKYIKLSRGEHGSIRKTYQEASEWIRQGVSVLFFPEGTRSPTGEINSFKNGAFKLAIREKKPILPVRIEGTRDIIPKGSWIFKTKTSCQITVLPEIDTRSYSPEEFDILKEKTRNILLAGSESGCL